MEEAIGVEYGDNFETYRSDGSLKVDVDLLNDRLKEDGFLTTLTEVDAYDSPAQAFTSKEVPNTQGRVLSGSSAINASFYSRADQDFYPRSEWIGILEFSWSKQSYRTISPRYGSLQLLLLSGIGLRPYLFSLGIPVARHSPYVGQFLYDNPRNGISIVPLMPLERSLIQFVGQLAPVFLIVATLMENIVGPLSAGSLRFASTDVRLNPKKRCVNGTRKIGYVLNSRAMDDSKFQQWFGGREFRYTGSTLPVNLSNDAYVEVLCRHRVSNIWQYHGGCLVGKVVDRNLKVTGIDSLRVINGSTFTVSPRTNPQATLLMLGRYFGLKLLKERSR
ncbi:(R)-mandelonitrile lyase-like [Olea europaea subsp. europaea]|uniref:(R)-mandelonitrile lyase-like n=1 Tax=Olea europaea subsp. europaea TaxID=158383 RepID=A0A8S0SQL6_OLEEU|nr:(R)-mandelonitrile lyase-like [Olea europaea subsp. europaea]